MTAIPNAEAARLALQRKTIIVPLLTMPMIILAFRATMLASTVNLSPLRSLRGFVSVVRRSGSLALIKLMGEEELVSVKIAETQRRLAVLAH